MSLHLGSDGGWSGAGCVPSLTTLPNSPEWGQQPTQAGGNVVFAIFVHPFLCVCVCVCPPLSGSFPSPTKSGLDTSGVSRERMRAVLHLSAGREMDGGG